MINTSIFSLDNIDNTENFQQYTLNFTVIEGSVALRIFFYQVGGTFSLIADDFSLTLDVGT